MDAAEQPPTAATLVRRLSRRPTTFWLVALAVQLPLLGMYLAWSWRFEHYHYFPFLLASVAALTWSRIRVDIDYPTRRLPAALFVLSLLVLLAGSVLGSPWFGAVSTFLLAASFLFTHRLSYLCVPLLLLVRLPLNYDNEIVTRLQTLTTRLSSYLLDLLSVPHLTRGNVIELPDRELFVAEACSGVQSAFTIAFVALLIAAWQRRPLATVPLCLLISLGWAVLGNVIRVTTIAYAATSLQVDLSQGVLHDALGYSTLLIAVLLTLSTDAMLGVLFHAIGGEPDEGFNPFIAVWERLFGQPVDTPASVHVVQEDSPEAATRWQRWLFDSGSGPTVAVLSLGAISMMPLAYNAITTPRAINPEGHALIRVHPTMLEEIEGPVKYRFIESLKGGADPRLGMNADKWELHVGDVSGLLVLSHPYPEWHELSACYALQGWELLSAQLLQPRSGSDHTNKIKLARLTRRDGALGYLLYSGLNGDGSVIDPPGDSFLLKTWVRCAQLATGRVEWSLYTGDCAMVQMWIVSERPLEPEELTLVADSMTRVRDRFAAELVKELETNHGQ
ncbi:MAG: exosortase U [Planctomycetaceae bacterium]